MRLVEVERRHPFGRNFALHGVGVAGDLPALAGEVARDPGVGTQLYVSVSHVDVAIDRGVDVHVPEIGVHVAVDGPLDAHVAEIGFHVAEHLALYQDVAEP